MSQCKAVCSIMSGLIRKLSALPAAASYYRTFSVSAVHNKTHSCKVLVVGGGSGGCTMASKFARKLEKDAVIVLEPSDQHYYQPLFTLVGAGVKSLTDCRKAEVHCLPESAIRIKDYAESIDPVNMYVKTRNGDIIQYEYVVIAVGVEYNYAKIPGLKEALDDKSSKVSTIYSPKYCEKTWSDLQNFKGGDAIFTYPDTPVKCPGAPQKILYLADSYLRKDPIKRSKSNLFYNTALPFIFGVKKYADALIKVAAKKDIHVNYHSVLKEVRHDKKEAVFYNTSSPKTTTVKFDLLHVTPPMVTPKFLSHNKALVDSTGYLAVNKFTLQHNTYPNVYGIGDCTNTPNSKTAAAIAKQSYVVEMNLLNTMGKKQPNAKYDGYGGCPLVTSYNTCILAEFIYDGVVRETMPFNQARESVLAYYMKKDLFPFLYWNLMLKGYYHGPETIRKIINPLGK